MVIPALPPDEDQRLARLSALQVMDTEPEPLFDHLAALAAQICGTPVALLGLIDEKRQWFKAAVGFGRSETPRAQTFCAHTLLADGLFEVCDAQLDERFATHPDVLANPPLRFYAGVPIRLDDGSHPGTLCVVDFQPRELTEAQREALTRLAGSAAEALMMRERVQARQAAVDEPFRLLAEIAPLGVFSADAAGRFSYTNAHWQRISGLSAQAALGAGWAATLAAEDAASVVGHWQRCVVRRQPFEMRYRLRHPGHELPRQVWVRARPLLTPDGQLAGYVGIAEDVTDRISAERELRDSKALLDRTGRVAGIGGWSLDLQTEEIVWSDQTCRIHDLAPGHRPTLDEAIRYYKPEARPVIEAAVQRGISYGEPWSLELPLVTATGRDIWVLAQGQVDWQDGVPVRLVGAFQDVTEHHRAAVELERSRQRLRALYESTPALMHSVDAEGRVLSVSDRWLERLGYRREEVLGRSIDDFLEPQSCLQVRDVFRPALWRDGHVDDCPVQLIRADGQLRDALVSAVAEYDAEGRPLRALALVDDITEELERRAELAREQQMRRQTEHHVHELDRLLHERSEMLDVLAHEVRQPLNNASAALQSAAASLAGRGEQQAQQRLTRAQAVLGQVLAGVDNTLAAASLLAGAASIARVDTDIDTLVAVTVADLPRDQRDRIVVHRHTATRTALMDMSLLRLALRNLLSNALKYAPGISPVTLHVMDFDEPAALQFEVADAGPGIPRELLPRLFTRGARGHGGTESTHGLGLYIVRRVMDLHGGSAELLRTGPLGTVMRLTLPQAG
ncbi:PAS domain S-box protein [Roseateles asaccharophilus]|uniref:histidine kinase n=1 Tax=Roseateles asaccharophilus TaxID=582607 RepID=A0ABU2A8V8_9BURK|nr:PAS domain S-box protein [Roseateles asaccharophilus]MDR7333028.1 PAS domain S-box-containing protein [Roseateles asaccharophilus]